MSLSNIAYTSPLNRAIQHTGVSKSMLRYCLQNHFSIDNPVIEACLKNYYLHYASPEYFFALLKEGIYKDHQVIYKDSLTSLRKESQIALSFREAISEYSLEKYVLVRKGTK